MSMTFKYGAPMTPTPFAGNGLPIDSRIKDKEEVAKRSQDISDQDPFRTYQRGVAEGIVEGRKQIYVWVLDGLKTLMPLLKLEFASRTLLNGFMYQLEKFSKTGRAPSNDDE